MQPYLDLLKYFKIKLNSNSISATIIITKSFLIIFNLHSKINTDCCFVTNERTQERVH